MAAAPVNNAVLSDLLQTGNFSDFTIVCQGKEFKLHKVVVCPQSPVIAAALEKASRSQSSSLPITCFDLATVECMVDFLYRGDYVINGDALHKGQTSGWAGPPNMKVDRVSVTPPPNLPLPQAAIRDILLCHVEVSAIGHHYKLPKLCERANKYLESILHDGFPAEIFPDLAVATYKSSEDAKLHDLVSTFAVEHVHTLVKTPNFERLAGLASFSSNLLQRIAAKLQANQNQLLEIQDREARDQEIIGSLEEKLCRVESSLSVVSAERDSATKKNSILTVERDSAQRALDEERKQKEAAVSERDRIKQSYTSERTKTVALVSSQDKLQQALDAEKKNYATLATQFNTLRQQMLDLTTDRDAQHAEKNRAQGETTALQQKIDALLDIVEDRDCCRNCENDFGCWIDEEGSRYILRCSHCRCRHYS